MTDPKQKLANIQVEIFRQRTAIQRKINGLKTRNEHKVAGILRSYRDLPSLELKAQKLEHIVRGPQQPG